mmetsp:Transcript_17917/g.43861  ORF Transcript_17917/g.43861 Transcript_17917/m.43861 type:complete len:345 (+) Transcript_17917:27-1061(+)
MPKPASPDAGRADERTPLSEDSARARRVRGTCRRGGQVSLVALTLAVAVTVLIVGSMLSTTAELAASPSIDAIGSKLGHHRGHVYDSSKNTRHLGGAEVPKGWCLPDEYYLEFEGAWRTPMTDLRPIPAFDGPVKGIVASKITSKGYQFMFAVKKNQSLSNYQGGSVILYNKASRTTQNFIFWESKCVELPETSHSIEEFEKNGDDRFCQHLDLGVLDLKKADSGLPGLDMFVMKMGPQWYKNNTWFGASDDASKPGTELKLQMKMYPNKVAVPFSHLLASTDGSYFVDHIVTRIEKEIPPNLFKVPEICAITSIQTPKETTTARVLLREEVQKNTRKCPFFGL